MKKLVFTKMSKAECYVNLGTKVNPKYKVDLYPEKDCFIPEACHFADKNSFSPEDWNVKYVGEMDRLLSMNKLRVL